jgi:hypothetical protein
VVKVVNHQSVDWLEYFKSIRSECPWSYSAWTKGLIDIVEYSGSSIPLGHYQARMYIVCAPEATVTAIAEGFNYTDTECEWLWSYPGYGDYATPVSVLIQQNRQELKRLRSGLNQD